MNEKDKLSSVALDPQGYLLDYRQWSELIALELAAQDKLILTDQHWGVISVLRAFYADHQMVPNNRVLAKLIRDSGVSGLADQLVRLFNPISPVSQAARIAGLPKARNCFEYRLK